MSWAAVPLAGRYDVVRGRLGVLRSSGGNFTTATDACVANDVSGLSVTFAGTPAPGSGDWFLVRGVNCGGPGSYNSGSAAQVGDRDAEINASPVSCP